MTKPPFHILIGNSDQDLNSLLVSIIHTALAGDFTLNITILDHVGKLSESAGKQKFDLCLLVLNNITTPKSDTVQERIDWVLDFIASLKAKHRTPVIALSGLDDLLLRERAGLAGADFYFDLPFDPEKLNKVVSKCVKMAGKFARPVFSSNLASAAFRPTLQKGIFDLKKVLGISTISSNQN